MKKNISFFVMVKNFNTGNIENYDVMPALYACIYAKNGGFSPYFKVYDKDYNHLPVNSKERLLEFVKGEFHHMYWGRCEWEFIAIDCPYRTEKDNGNLININSNRPIKVDVYQQLEPNIPIIVDLLWEEIKEML